MVYFDLIFILVFFGDGVILIIKEKEMIILDS